MKSHPSSKPSATGPITGHSGEVSTPEMSPPPRPLKPGADRHGFPNREAIVRKALERFLSVENPISRLPAGAARDPAGESRVLSGDRHQRARGDWQNHAGRRFRPSPR